MVQAPRRGSAPGAPALVLLLAELADLDICESAQSLPDRLSQWLGWTDAIALSSALNGAAPSVAADTRTQSSEDTQLCARVRQSLTNAFAADSVLAPARRDRSARARALAMPVDSPPDQAVFRQAYLSAQQSMETEIGQLRGRLRSRLAARSPEMARLAVLDAVMERALGERERSLLASVPAVLGACFERLRKAQQSAEDADAGMPADDAWLDTFRKTVQRVMLAELDVRFQPVEGLLAALRTCQPPRYAQISH